MAKKPKDIMQVKVRERLETMGIGYKELAERIGSTEGTVRQAMCKNGYHGVKKKICDYLNIKIDKEGA